MKWSGLFTEIKELSERYPSMARYITIMLLNHATGSASSKIHKRLIELLELFDQDILPNLEEEAKFILPEIKKNTKDKIQLLRNNLKQREKEEAEYKTRERKIFLEESNTKKKQSKEKSETKNQEEEWFVDLD